MSGFAKKKIISPLGSVGLRFDTVSPGVWCRGKSPTRGLKHHIHAIKLKTFSRKMETLDRRGLLSLSHSGKNVHGHQPVAKPKVNEST
jgi:hypothetical protein